MLLQETFQEKLESNGTVFEVRISPMPDGGIVTTYTDITERVMAEEALARANETLERRVRERTEELTRVNERLVEATRAAEEANIGKTRFLAAAGHDILQPLNAARLYASVLVDKLKEGEDGSLVRNVETVAGIGRGHSRGRARYLPARHRCLETRADCVPFGRNSQRPRTRLPAHCQREGPGADDRPDLRFGSHRPPAAAPPTAEPGFQRNEIHTRRHVCLLAAVGTAIG